MNHGKNVDFSVLEFDNYTDYINSFATVHDYRYLNNQRTIKTIVQLGYRTTKVPYTADEFAKRVNMAVEAIRPKTAHVGLFSDLMSPTNQDPVLLEFKAREPLNLNKILSVSKGTPPFLSIVTNLSSSLADNCFYFLYKHRRIRDLRIHRSGYELAKLLLAILEAHGLAWSLCWSHSAEAYAPPSQLLESQI